MTKPKLKTVEDYVNLESVKPDHHLSYGDHPEQFSELYLSGINSGSSDTYPVIILIHGGCWRAQFGLFQLGLLSKALTGLFEATNLRLKKIQILGTLNWSFQIAKACLILKRLCSIFVTECKSAHF